MCISDEAEVLEIRMSAVGVDMANMGGNSSVAAFSNAAFLAACTFTNNTFLEDPSISQVTASGNSSQVWLQDVTLDASEGPMTPLVSQNGGSFYSAVPVPVWTAGSAAGSAAGSVAGAAPPDDVVFLDATDPWIVSAAAVRLSLAHELLSLIAVGSRMTYMHCSDLNLCMDESQ